MDEGINTFATARTLDQFFGPQYYSKRYFGGFVPWVFGDLPMTRATDGNLLTYYRTAGGLDAQSEPTWRYWPGNAAVLSYAKTSLWMHTLERMLGWETVQKILSAFFNRYAFSHPKPQDFFSVANEVSGRDLTWFFDQVHRSSASFDYKVDIFTSERVEDFGAWYSRTSRNFAGSGTAKRDGSSSTSSGQPARSVPRSIRIAFCCSIRTTPTTADPYSHAPAPRPARGRWRGSCGSRTTC
jgi:hypothetical protein